MRNKILAYAVCAVCLAATPSIQAITAYAAEQTLPYSPNWETQPDGSWKYKYNTGGYAVDRWIHDEVDGNWYLMDDTGVMRYGVVKSYGKYYLLSELHDGHYGHMVKNGEVYQGVTIIADTSDGTEGALTSDTINALRSIGINVDNVIDVSGTQHTTAGEDEIPAPSQETPSKDPTDTSDEIEVVVGGDGPTYRFESSNDGVNSNSDDGEGLKINLNYEDNGEVYKFE